MLNDSGMIQHRIVAVLATFALSVLAQGQTTQSSTKADIDGILKTPTPMPALLEVVKANPKDGWALFGLGYLCQMKRDTASANTYYGRADTVIDVPELTFDRALNDLSVGQARRAVGSLLRELQAHSDRPEIWTDLLGHALSRVEKTALGQPNEIAATVLLESRSRMHEITRKGLHKWGGTWLDAAGWDDLQARIKLASNAVFEATRKDTNLKKDVEVARARYATASTRAASAKGDSVAGARAERDRCYTELKNAEARERAAAADVEDAKKKIPVPTWPTKFAPMW